MYKYFKKDEYNVMEFDFDSITEFLRYNEEAPICRTFKDERLASDTGDYSFTKTHSYDEAKELCKYGFHEKFEKLVDLKGEGRAGMAPQSIAHLIIMIFIILGNLAFIAENRKMSKKKA